MSSWKYIIPNDQSKLKLNGTNTYQSALSSSSNQVNIQIRHKMEIPAVRFVPAPIKEQPAVRSVPAKRILSQNQHSVSQLQRTCVPRNRMLIQEKELESPINGWTYKLLTPTPSYSLHTCKIWMSKPKIHSTYSRIGSYQRHTKRHCKIHYQLSYLQNVSSDQTAKRKHKGHHRNA